MQPDHEHAFYAWLIVIAAVCIVTLVGALLDRFYLNRRLQRQTPQVNTPQPAADSSTAK